MEKKMETTIVDWGYIGVMVLYWDNEKENGNYYSKLGLHRGYIIPR